MKLRRGVKTNTTTCLALTSGLGVLLMLWLVTLQLTHADQKPQAFKPDQNWLATVQNNIEAQEYRPSKQMVGLQGEKVKEPKWHINNRAQGFKSAVSKDGWEIAPRPPAKRIDPKDPTKHLKETAAKKDEAPKWHWHYRFSALSRGAERTKLATPEVSDKDETVYLKYSPSVSEWYKNSKAGIEQGFEIKEKPHAKGKGELVLVGEVETDLAVNKPSKEKISFSKTGAEFVQYAGLKVLDASGKTIPSWLSYSAKSRAQRLLIHIDDSEAVYPLLVDPLATSPTWVGESNQIDARYGYSVGTAGDVNGDGYSDVIVGAYVFDNGENDEGQAYLFLGSASGLVTTAAWTREGNQDNAEYGFSVGSAGDVNGDGFSDVVVGASGYDRGLVNEGEAYVYLGSAAGLGTTAAWTGGGDEASAGYGYSVSSAGDVNGDGYSDVVVGTKDYAPSGEQPIGRAYLYLGSASGLATDAAWTGTPGAQALSDYGYSVSTAGDVNGDGFADVLVGAPQFNNPEDNEGQAFLYLGAAAGLGTTAAWTGDDGDQIGASYGSSVSTAGDVNGDGYSDVLVGAFNFTNTQGYEGAAFLYLGSASGLSTTPSWLGAPDQASASYGYSARTAGDVNGDGYADVVVGAHFYDNGEADEGRAYLYFGSAAGLATTAGWIGESNQADAAYGWSVGTAGDVNGDGASDVLVGAKLYSNGEGYEGQVSLYLGILDVLPTPTPTPTPVIISPGSGGLPAPAVTTTGRSATITAPQVTPQLSTRARNAAIKKLMKSGLTRPQAMRALTKLKLTYIFTVKQGGSASSSSDEIGTQASSITRRSKRNRLTLNNLAPGAKAASYRIEIAAGSPPVVLGVTKPSAQAVFAIAPPG